MKKSTRVVLVIILCLVLIAIGISRNFSFNAYNYDNADRYTAGDCKIDRQVTTVDVSWIAGKVHIGTHDGEEIILSETASRKLKENEEVHWLLEGDTLYVKYVRSGRNFSSRMNKELTLLLPEGLQLEDVLISTVSAEVDAELPTAESVKIQTVSGTVDTLMEQAEEVRVTTVSGGVELSFATAPQSIDAETVSADITVRLPENAGFKAELDSVSGRIGGQLLEGSEGGKNYSRGDGACSISMDSVSGELKLDAYTR